jgi:hypothetical protein
VRAPVLWISLLHQKKKGRRKASSQWIWNMKSVLLNKDFPHLQASLYYYAFRLDLRLFKHIFER